MTDPVSPPSFSPGTPSDIPRHAGPQTQRRGRDHDGVQTMGPTPIFVLVEPQMGENIGAAARAMLNFGVRAMRLVNPRDGWPNPAAGATAAGAAAVVDNIRVFDTTAEALADCAYVLATTARNREMRLPVLSPSDGAAAMGARLHSKTPQRCAILFGGERAGLTSEDVARADGILTIPVNPAFASLNLAQAVLVMAYEWGQFCAQQDAAAINGFDSPLTAEPPAPGDQFDRMVDHLITELDDGGFFHPPEKKRLMVRNLTVALKRAQLTENEVQTFRGVIKALAQGRGARAQMKETRGARAQMK
ncbi:MAG: RNA methyltransferase, partial [Pseudomonadota bacterium]